MLVQFSVENFLSFDENTTFSMLASSDEAHPSHTISVEGFRRGALLRGAAIYGANAAGKSNLFTAVAFAQNRIVAGARPGQTLPVRPFRLRRRERPSRFQFHFVAAGYLFDYGFAVDAQQIHEEWLFATALEKNAREQMWFERTTNDGKTEVQFSNALTHRSDRTKQRLQFIAEGTRPNQLFLTEAIERNVEELQPVWGWFEDVLLVLPAEAQARNLPVMAHKEADFVSFLANFLRQAGTGISNVKIIERSVDFDRDFVGLPESIVAEIKEKCNPASKEEIVVVQTPVGRRHLLCRPNAEPLLVQFKMEHQSVEGQPVEFDFEEESDGTRRLIHLAPLLAMLRENEGRVILLDEIDRRLHTHLSRAFVQAVLEAENRKSQFIFTTHDTNLLDLDILRRDEIWFMEKDKGGASNLYSLAEFKVRPDLQIEKGYLNGRFGAIPFVGDLSRLGVVEEKSE